MKILSCLAYGDFVVDAYFSMLIKNSKLLCPSYLKTLADALNFPCDQIEYFDLEGIIPPDAFNIKRQGLKNAVDSLLQLKSALMHYCNEEFILFNSYDVRWRFVNPTKQFRAVRGRRENIYEAYYKKFALADDFNRVKFKAPKKISIFPDSRQEQKCIPISMVIALQHALHELGIESKVISNRDIQGPLTIATNVSTLEGLIAEIKNADFVITADSLPMHLARFYGVPEWVILHRPNPFLLPPEIIKLKRWSLFHDDSSLVKYLSAII